MPSSTYYELLFYKLTFMFVPRIKKLLVRSTSVESYLVIFPLANRVDSDQAALARAA